MKKYKGEKMSLKEEVVKIIKKDMNRLSRTVQYDKMYDETAEKIIRLVHTADLIENYDEVSNS